MRQTDASLEDARRVVGNQVNTTKLLDELSADTEERTIPELLSAILEECLERASSRSLTFFVDSLLDPGSFSVQVFGVDRKLSRLSVKATEDGNSFVRAIVGNEPLSH